jgi:hypothetical protein
MAMQQTSGTSGRMAVAVVVLAGALVAALGIAALTGLRAGGENQPGQIRVLSAQPRNEAAVTTQLTRLGQRDDYGLRHANEFSPGPLGQRDDYGLRHANEFSAGPLGQRDDYGLRHANDR